MNVIKLATLLWLTVLFGCSFAEMRNESQGGRIPGFSNICDPRLHAGSYDTNDVVIAAIVPCKKTEESTEENPVMEVIGEALVSANSASVGLAKGALPTTINAAGYVLGTDNIASGQKAHADAMIRTTEIGTAAAIEMSRDDVDVAGAASTKVTETNINSGNTNLEGGKNFTENVALGGQGGTGGEGGTSNAGASSGSQTIVENEIDVTSSPSLGCETNDCGY